MKRFLSLILIILISQFQIVNFATAGEDGTLAMSDKKKSKAETKDCFESLNRGIFAFNQGLDKVIFKPLAKGYITLPKPIRSGTSNVLSNISNVVTIPNNILQGDFGKAGVNTGRLLINTTIGIFLSIFKIIRMYFLVQ